MLLRNVLATLLVLLVSLLVLATIRLLSILPPRRPRPAKRPRNAKSHIMIFLGSGGHTAEMLLMLSEVDMDRRFAKRSWVVSQGDEFSGRKAREFEAERARKGKFEVVTVPRARRVHQGLSTTPLSCFWCFVSCLSILRSGAPHVILTNGPGTGVVLVLASLLLRFCNASEAERTRIVYVESLARVRKLSLSGSIMRALVDRFIVQWEKLEGEYRGPLVLDAARRVGVGDGVISERLDTKSIRTSIRI